jgi:hypothetical protein
VHGGSAKYALGAEPISPIKLFASCTDSGGCGPRLNGRFALTCAIESPFLAPLLVRRTISTCDTPLFHISSTFSLRGCFRSCCPVSLRAPRSNLCPSFSSSARLLRRLRLLAMTAVAYFHNTLLDCDQDASQSGMLHGNAGHPLGRLLEICPGTMRFSPRSWPFFAVLYPLLCPYVWLFHDF